MLTRLPFQNPQNPPLKILIYPTRIRYSAPAPTKALVHSASYSSLPNPFALTKFVIVVLPSPLLFSKIPTMDNLGVQGPGLDGFEDGEEGGASRRVP